MKNRYIILFSAITLAFIICGFLSIKQNDGAIVEAEETHEITNEEFEPDSIIISFTREETLKFKEYSKEDFAEIGCLDVEDLTQYTVNYVYNKLYDKEIEKPMLVDVENFKRILRLELSVKTKENVLQAIKTLSEREEILSVSPNFIYHIESVPNDYYYNETDYAGYYLWNYKDDAGINAEQAWDIDTGSDSVIVGVLDSGIDASHPDLAANISTAGLHRDCTVYPIATVANANLTDPNGHGTHVAGIIGARGNNSIGVTGVCWNISFVSLRVFDAFGFGSTLYTARAINFAASEGVPILNYSGGGYFYDNNFNNIISNYSGLLVCAAGNGKTDPITHINYAVDTDSDPHYPSVFSDETNYNYSSLSSRVISVGATDRYGERAIFSNFGEKTVSLYAPGVDILSSFPTNKCLENEYVLTDYGYWLKCECVNYSGVWKPASIHHDNGYHCMNGTSMATPHVTGVAALMLSVNPYLTASQLKDIILENTDTICITLPDSTTQYVKKLNAHKSVAAALLNINEYGQITGKKAGAAFSGTLNIPDKINGITVTGVAEYAFIRGTSITALIFPDTLTTIGTSAFEDCSFLSSITWGIGITTIGIRAFENCCSLTSLNIPSSVTSIGASAFSSCGALESVALPSSVTAISSNTFSYCTSLTDINFPATLTAIGESAFYACTMLERVDLPSSLVSIGSWAFQSCLSLKRVIIRRDNSVVSLGGYVFSDTSTSLKIYVPYQLKNSYSSATNWSDYANKIEGCIFANNLTLLITELDYMFSTTQISTWETHLCYYVQNYGYVYEEYSCSDDVYISRSIENYGYVDEVAYCELDLSTMYLFIPQTVVGAIVHINVGSTYDGCEVVLAHTDYETIESYEVINGSLNIDISEIFESSETEFLILPADGNCNIEFSSQDISFTITYLSIVPISI